MRDLPVSSGTLHLVTSGLDTTQLGALCHGLGGDDAVVLIGAQAAASLANAGFDEAVSSRGGAERTWKFFDVDGSHDELPPGIEAITAQSWAELVEHYERTLTWGS